jgi:glycolate oxidase
MKKAEEHNLFYPPDPASYDESAMGGNVAECAGGLHCKKYGVTKDYVIGLRAVTIDGKILKTGLFSDGDIFDLTSLLIGSEGLLAAVTEIAVRLIDLPVYGPTILAAFDSPENAALVVSEVTGAGIRPSVMEYMDGDAVDCSNKYEKSLDIERAEAILLFETTGSECKPEAASILDYCRQNKATTLKVEPDPLKSDYLWKIRRNLSKAVKESARYKIAEDVCVPPSRLPELVKFVLELNREYPVRVNSYGHAGDGNLHVNFLVDDEKLVESGLIAEGIMRLFRKTLELGGTLTGEHGIGLTKKKYLGLEFDGATLNNMKLIKAAFDPKNLFNPGKMFD